MTSPCLARLAAVALRALPLLLLAGCASAPTTATRTIGGMAYEPLPAPTRIVGSATIEATHEVDAATHASFATSGFSVEEIGMHQRMVADALAHDLTSSGLFERILPANDVAVPDYIVRAHGMTVKVPDTRFRLSITVTRGSDPGTTVTLSREIPLPDNTTFAQILPAFMTGAKGAIAASIEQMGGSSTARAEVARMQGAPLSEIIQAADASVAVARERNRIIIATRTRQLPDMLKNWPGADLTAFAIKLEQIVLDLNHECEVAKDQAQQAMATGGASTGGSVDELRGLAICYRERIELLKPMVVAIKEELAARER